ncbi:proline--tRNA ligase [Nesterenkonia halobia]|uniref:Proline--tRNA ligase n=1 Tax=Nesterenkonia halobia TaxID=37922 RepID=A0ABP6R9K5_9MICC
MPLRLSSLFLRTLRDNPADAEVASHQLMVRAGCIRRAAPGIYSWLPLGMKLLRNLEEIVREEMEHIGSQEVHFPALLPKEPYEATGRWADYGDNMFRLQDRKDADYLLAPTHEEVFTLAVKDLYTSYKDLPLSIYQIQTKYRDEARPRAGLLRGREFIMKDSYSFALEQQDQDAAYAAHRAAYLRIFDRLGLEVVPVDAVSGAMGGSASEEFLFPCAIGEDTFVESDGGYRANVEAVTTVAPEPVDASGLPPAEVHHTPGTDTIETLVAAAQADHPRPDRAWTAADTLKNVVIGVDMPDGTRKVAVIGLPGDRAADLKRIEAAVGEHLGAAGEVAVEAGTEADLRANPGLVRGYIGPGLSREEPVLGVEGSSGVPYLVDPRVVEGTSWITGANAADQHVFGLVAGRDFGWDGVIEAAEVREGDEAPDGSGPLRTRRGIELGHIFHLGTGYAEALGLKVLDVNGKLATVTMGSYGFGVTRVLAALAEANHDEKGLIWPGSIAPADVHVVATGKDQAIHDAAEQLVADLEVSGVSTLFDDRPKVSPGVKFSDAELLGMPTIVVVGRGLAEGNVELKDRRSGESEQVRLDGAVSVIAERAAALR